MKEKQHTVLSSYSAARPVCMFAHNVPAHTTLLSNVGVPVSPLHTLRCRTHVLKVSCLHALCGSGTVTRLMLTGGLGQVRVSWLLALSHAAVDKPDEGADMAAALSPLKPQKRKYQQRLTAARDCRGLGLFCGGGRGGGAWATTGTRATAADREGAKSSSGREPRLANPLNPQRQPL